MMEILAIILIMRVAGWFCEVTGPASSWHASPCLPITSHHHHCHHVITIVIVIIVSACQLLLIIIIVIMSSPSSLSSLSCLSITCHHHRHHRHHRQHHHRPQVHVHHLFQLRRCPPCHHHIHGENSDVKTMLALCNTSSYSLSCRQR